MSGESKSSSKLRDLIVLLFPDSNSNQRSLKQELLELCESLESLNSILKVHLKEEKLKKMMNIVTTIVPKGILKQLIQKSLLEIEVLKEHPVPRLQRFIESIRSCVDGKFYTNDLAEVWAHAYRVFKELRDDLETRTGTYQQDASNMLNTIRRNLNNLEDALNAMDIYYVNQYLGFMWKNFDDFKKRYERFIQDRQLKSTPEQLKLYVNIRTVFFNLISMTDTMILEWKKMKQEDLNIIKKTHPVRLRL